jgi:hypothetical protein
MYPTITIYDGSSTTTLCHGVGQRTTSEWRLEGDIQAPVDFVGGPLKRALRAANSIPLGRVTRDTKVSFVVSQAYATVVAAYEARLTLANTVPVAGTLYINLSATRRVKCLNAQIEQCAPRQTGLLVVASFSFACGAVSAENYT